METENTLKRPPTDELSSINQKKIKIDETIKDEAIIKNEDITKDEDTKIDTVSEKKRLGKFKKVAMCLSYSGKGYYGMQRNPPFETIESKLFEALLKANIITKQQSCEPKILLFQRAARTDKGVSAQKQVVSIKLPSNMDYELMAELINQQLPDQIKVMGIKRCTKNFNSKLACSARIYSYMFPTFALMPKDQLLSEDYRVTDDKIDELNKVFSNFIGCHNFHNFTSGRKPNDASAKRYIISFECGKPFIQNNMEFAIIRIKGQSFMLHQIRKMVGLSFAIVKGLTNLDVLIKTWQHQRVDVPKAPGLGLMLEEICYEHYNKKYGSDGLHESLEWDNSQEKFANFYKEYIFSTIANTEVAEKPMLQWLETLPLHSFDFRAEIANIREVPTMATNGKLDEDELNQSKINVKDNEDVNNKSTDDC